MNKKQKREFFECIKASAMPEHHKDFVYLSLRECLAPKPVEKKIRRVKSNNLFTLQEWEDLTGQPLHSSMITGWIVKKALCPFTIANLIEEFRLEMLSKNKQYADFKATFQTYLNKGYLSKKFPEVLWMNSPHRKQDNVHISQRGSSI